MESNLSFADIRDKVQNTQYLNADARNNVLKTILWFFVAVVALFASISVIIIILNALGGQPLMQGVELTPGVIKIIWFVFVCCLAYSLWNLFTIKNTIQKIYRYILLTLTTSTTMKKKNFTTWWQHYRRRPA